MNMVLKIERINSDVLLPTQGHVGDAAYDLYAAEEVTLAPGERTQVPTGIKIEIPEGYIVFIWDRSSMSHTYGLKTLGGVIDSGYRGEVKVGLVNLSDEIYTIEKNHKIAQMVVQKQEKVTIIESKVSPNTHRGENAFGSTGK